MARVHCPDCEMAVVVDPHGVCPEGHLIGNAGRRIELAIGDHTPHPDEPEPWSAVIEAADALAAEEEPAPREIRPISIAGEDEPAEESQESEDLMRELHALSDLDARTEERAATGPTAPEPPHAEAHEEEGEPEVYRAPVAEGSPDTPRPAPRPLRAHRSDEDLEAIAELAALFDQAPSKPSETPPPPPPPAATAPPADEATAHAAPAHDAPAHDAPAHDTSDQDAGTGEVDEHLASVSHLPYAGAQQGSGAPASPERDTTRASGEAFDWSHFTAKGKRRRFGR